MLLPAGAGAACVTNQDCNDGNLCTTDICNAGTCSYQNNALPCSDGNACTVGDTCGNGMCGSGSPMSCNDSNPCTDDICDSNLGCLHAANSAACTDSNSCTSNDVCNGEVCVGGNKASGCTACQAVANIPADGGTFVGTTSGTSTLAGSCANTSTAPERVYRWIPENSGPAQIQTCSTSTNFDTVVYLRQGNCTSGSQVACNDDTVGCGVADGSTNASKHGSRINPVLTAGQTYFIVVDGYGGRAGTFRLTVTPPSVCGNNLREGLEECDGSQRSNCTSGQCTAQCTCVPPGTGLPDLTPAISSVSVVFNTTAASGDVAEGCAESTSGVDLMRFSVTSSNVGTRDFALGTTGCPSPCDAHPLEVCANPQFVCSPAEGHNHAHYDNYAKYELLDQSGQALVVGHKQGFCLRDTPSCSNATYTCTNQGISAGCFDIYASTLGCQYLDITGVPSGSYTLRVSVDPFSRIAELSETNNVTSVSVTIPPRAGTTTSTITSATTTTTVPTGACTNATVVPAAGGTFTGTTNGSSTLAGTCGTSGASPEKVFRWTPSRSGTATIRTCGTATKYDTVLYARSGSCTGTQLACNDDTAGCAVSDGSANADHHGSVITPTVTAGQTYFIVVDGYNGKKGNFGLTIIPPP